MTFSRKMNPDSGYRGCSQFGHPGSSTTRYLLHMASGTWCLGTKFSTRILNLILSQVYTHTLGTKFLKYSSTSKFKPARIFELSRHVSIFIDKITNSQCGLCRSVPCLHGMPWSDKWFCRADAIIGTAAISESRLFYEPLRYRYSGS